MVERFNENSELDYSELEVFVPELEDLHGEVERGMGPEEVRDLTEEEFNTLIHKDALAKEEMEAVVKYANENHFDDLYLGLTSLDAETAATLAKFEGYSLYLNGLTSLDTETAATLAKFEGYSLYLNGLTSLDAEVGATLAKFKGYDLYLNGLINLDEETALKLVKLDVTSLYLYLDGLTSLDVETAAALAEFEGEYESGLSLGGLTSLDVETAAALAKFKGGHLYLNGIISLDVETAAALAECNKELSLDGLTSLDVETAAALAEFKGGYFSLDGLTSLDVETAAALAEFKGGYLSLDGLTSLDVETAAALAEFKGGYLSLDGLKSLDVETARALAKFKGEFIGLYGIENVSDEVAGILIPIKSKIWGSYLIEKIDGIERKIMDGGLNGLQRKIENIKKKKDWKEERGNIEYKMEEREISSWGNMVKVERRSKDTIKLKGYGLILTLEEGMWLANFKNWFKHTYPDQKVEFKKDKLNKKLAIRKTLCVGNTMLMSRHDLVEHLPYLERDGLMEALVKWLNS